MNIKNRVFIFVCMLTLIGCTEQNAIIIIDNTTSNARYFEDVEIGWSRIASKLPSITPERLVVQDADGEQPYQIIYDTAGQPEAVLIQVSVEPNTKAEYTFSKGTPSQMTPQAFGRFVPERKDDFAWENNKVAYRMYGPALEQTGEVSNGIDVWAKRTENLIIDKWYEKGDYHKDHGEGLDYYKVGRTLGAGAMAPIHNDDIVLGNNFISYEVLENGPLRTKFKLNYAPLKVGDKMITENRIVSLSANSHYNKIEQSFDGNFEEMPVAAGIVLRNDDDDDIMVDNKNGIITYQEPEMGGNGQLVISVILADNFERAKRQQGHLLGLATIKQGKTLTYYVGNGWCKADFEDKAKWIAYTQNYINSMKQPLVVLY